MATEFEQKYNSEAYLEPKPLTIFAKNVTSDIWLGSKYASVTDRCLEK